MNSYTGMPGLEEIVLEESYVLAVRAEPGMLVLAVDFLLTPRHPRYVAPGRYERDCFHKGRLTFLAVRRLVWDRQGAAPAVDAAGEFDYGHIDAFSSSSGTYRFSGEWGDVEVSAREVVVTLDD